MGRRLSVCAALLALITVLAALVTSGQSTLLDVDMAVGRAVVVHGSGGPIDVLRVLTAPGTEGVRYPLLMPVLGFLLWYRRWRLAAFVAVATLTVSPLTSLLKDVVGRERPSYPGTSTHMSGLSFPSGHASGAAVLAGVIVVLLWRRTRRRAVLVAGAALGALAVGWTRMALGVHYLSDVAAGLALGTVVVLLSALVLGDQNQDGSHIRERQSS